MKTIAVSITEGRTVRDLFCNGLLDRFHEAGFETLLFTEAARVPEFAGEWERPGIKLAHFDPVASGTANQRAYALRRRIAKTGNRALLRWWLRREERLTFPPDSEALKVFQATRPGLLLTTHAHLPAESSLLTAAHSMGIPSLGVVRSWDNVHKGLRSRPQRLAVWNDINREEVIAMERYAPEDLHVIGSPQFDPYFQHGTVKPREAICARFRLDPSRPILLFATLGNFFPGFDETCWMDVLLGLVDRREIPGDPQVVCRLHPWSRLEMFEKYARHPAVRLSYVNRYWPSLQWTMTRDDVVEVANLLAHADVVITPGSTITLEAAIFDRPTLVPVFHPYQPERAMRYFGEWVLGKHFRRIEEGRLVPILREEGEYLPAILDALGNPGRYAAERQRLVCDYAHFTDGRSTDRLAELAMSLAEATNP